MIMMEFHSNLVVKCFQSSVNVEMTIKNYFKEQFFQYNNSQFSLLILAASTAICMYN